MSFDLEGSCGGALARMRRTAMGGLHLQPRNINGLQKEWWYHRDGCGKWFVAERDTTSNEVNSTY